MLSSDERRTLGETLEADLAGYGRIRYAADEMQQPDAVARPRWLSVVGTIGILIACLGILFSIQSFFAPQMLEMQQGIFKSMSSPPTDEIGESRSGPQMPQFPPEMIEQFKDWTVAPSWFSVWSRANGLAGFSISLGYLISCVLLLLLNPRGFQYFPFFAWAAIGWNVVRLGVAIPSGSMMIMGMIPSAILSLVLHGVLLTVYRQGEKDAFSLSAA